VLLLADFTPLEYRRYYSQLFGSIGRRGLVVHSQLSPIVGLTPDGKYVLVSRDRGETRRAVFEHICRIREGG